MDATWIAPAFVLLAASAAMAGLVVKLRDASRDLARSARRLQHLEHGLIPVRVETRRLRASNDSIRHR